VPLHALSVRAKNPRPAGRSASQPEGGRRRRRESPRGDTIRDV